MNLLGQPSHRKEARRQGHRCDFFHAYSFVSWCHEKLLESRTSRHLKVKVTTFNLPLLLRRQSYVCFHPNNFVLIITGERSSSSSTAVVPPSVESGEHWSHSNIAGERRTASYDIAFRQTAGCDVTLRIRHTQFQHTVSAAAKHRDAEIDTAGGCCCWIQCGKSAVTCSAHCKRFTFRNAISSGPGRIS